MKYSVFPVFVALTVMLSSCEPLAPEASKVFYDVNVLTMEENEVQSAYTVMIDEGRISWVGPTDDAVMPDDAEIIEGDYYIMPGLAEMHAHIPSPEQNGDYMEDALKLYLSQGITTIRGMLGHERHLELREKAADGDITSPRIFTSGPSFSGGSVDDPEQAREMVREQYEAGYDLLKLHPGLELDQFEAIADEANELGIEFSGHISLDVGLERSLEAGQGTIDHLDRYMEFLAGDAADRDDPPIIYFGYDLAHDIDEDLIDEAARKTAEAGTWNVPTNTLLENVFHPDYDIETMQDWPGMEYMPEEMVQNWTEYVEDVRAGEDYDPEQAERFIEIRNELTAALHEHNAGLMLGADAPQIFNPPGFSGHRELESLVNAGLSPFEALQTATSSVGTYLGEETETGMVQQGFRADLLVLDVNPLESIPFHDHISGVVMQGNFYDRNSLDEMLEGIRERVND